MVCLTKKPSLTTRYSGVSPWGCHVGLLACIVPTGGCQSLLAAPTHTTLGCTLSGCPVGDGFLPMCVHLPVGACARVHRQPAEGVLVHATVHLCFPTRLSASMCIRSFFLKNKTGNEKGKESQYTNTGAWHPRPPTGIIFSFSTHSEGGEGQRGEEAGPSTRNSPGLQAEVGLLLPAFRDGQQLLQLGPGLIHSRAGGYTGPRHQQSSHDSQGAPSG